MNRNRIHPFPAQVILTVIMLALAGFFGAQRALAQSNANPPERMTYQGFLADGNGIPLATNGPKNYDLVFRVFDAQTAGNRLWTEQQTVTVDKGYFSVLLGEGTQLGAETNPPLSTLFTNATASDRFVEMTVKGIGTGGNDVTMLPRLRLLTSPYAYLASRALTVSGAAITSGIVADARLSTNVALLNGANIFTTPQEFRSGLRLSDTNLWLRTGNDINHGLGWYGTGKLWGTNNVDGPVLFGWSGGTLGTTVGGERMVLGWNSLGRVGIGTNAPGDSLEVIGWIRGSGFRTRQGTSGAAGANAFNFFWSGTALQSYIDNQFVGTVQFTSDRRLKEDIHPLGDSAVERVMSLKPVSFKYKTIPDSIFSGSPMVQEGFIADELQEVIPSGVTGEKDGLTRDGKIQSQTINVLPVVSILTKAMQEQQQTIQNQQAQIDELKAMVEALANKQ